jgi:nucleotide-binding universal stress UspA family protein
MNGIDERLDSGPDIVPVGRSGGAIRRVLLATDLSDASEAATERAIEVAQGLGADLLVVSVIDPKARRAGGDLRVDQVRRIQEARIADVVERARRRRIGTEFLIWTGDAGESIVDAAEAERADLVVVGSRGRGSLGRAILGSVSDHVVRHAPCPVMVVRPRAVEADVQSARPSSTTPERR